MANEEDHLNPSDERSPLLNRIRTADDPEQTPTKVLRAQDIQHKVLILIVAIAAVVSVANILQAPPRTRLLESIYCRRFYEANDPTRIEPGGSVDEQYCKIDSVQTELALLKGWMDFFDYLPGVFLAVPFGVLADRYGRKWIFVMVLTAAWIEAAWIYAVCAFPYAIPIRLVWLGAISNIFGGGLMVGIALFYTIIADVTPQAERASVFFRFTAVMRLCTLITPPICAKLMERDPWIPITIGVGLQVLGIPLALALPESLKAKLDDEPDKSDDASTQTTSDSRLFILFGSGTKDGYLVQIKAMLSIFLEQSAFLVRDWRTIILVLTFPIRMAQNTLDNLLLQYISKRYEWTLARATYIWSFQSGIDIISLLIVLPAASSYLLQRQGYSAMKKDSILACVGLLMVAIGLFIEGFAPAVPILIIGLFFQTFGSGTGASIRALMTSFVKQNEVAKLYSVMAIAETLGMMGAGPIVAGLFSAGMIKGGGIWLGLPFNVLGAALFLMSMILWFLLLRKRRDESKNGGEDEISEDMLRAGNLHSHATTT